MMPAPMPWMGCGVCLPPDRTGLASGSTATILSPGRRGFSAWPTPVTVPPVPTPETKISSLRHEAVGYLLQQLLGAGDRAGDALLARRELEPGAQEAQHLAPLDRHRIGHGADHLVAARGGHEGKADAGIARGRLDDGADAGLDLARLLGGIDHRHADAILHRGHRIEEFELGQDFCRHALALGQAVETDQGRRAHGLGDVAVDAAAEFCLGHAALIPRNAAMTQCRYTESAKISAGEARSTPRPGAARSGRASAYRS